MPFHAIAIMSGGRQKTLPNKSEEQMLSEVVIPFVATGVVTARWGSTVQTYQVLELRIFETANSWDKKAGPLSDLLVRKRNQIARFTEKASRLLAQDKARVFVVMPIQGAKHGTQEDQRIGTTFDDRFEAIEKVISGYGGVAIRIDREYALEDLVGRIKKEIRASIFVVADMTDERQSCYFEAGFAEALGKPVIYIASKQSVMKPGTDTKIHFDIHMNVNFFTNDKELSERLSSVIEKNKDRLFAPKKNDDDEQVGLA
jgi:hypothetical protein